MADANIIEGAKSTGPQPFFHEGSGAVRFWVSTADGAFIGASIRQEVLRFRFHASESEPHALAAYMARRRDIDAAVLRRIAQGALEPVMLRESDFPVERS